MSLTLDQARAGVLAVVQGVSALSGVPVYDYLRHVTTEAELRTLLLTGTRVHFWSVTPALDETVTVRRYPGAGGCDQADPFRFDVHGYYALEDAAASEKAFLTIAWDVFEALRTTKHLSGDIGTGPPQWTQHNHVMLAAVLCHHVKFSFAVKASLP